MMAQSHDDWLLSGPGGPNDDDLPVECPKCLGRCTVQEVTEHARYGPQVTNGPCPICYGEGMIGAEKARRLLRERAE